jgi:hypothetical protein
VILQTEAGGRNRAIADPPGSRHLLCDLVMAAVRAGFAIRNLHEDTPDAARFPRAEKYVGWPMLVAMVPAGGEGLPQTAR